MLFRRTDYSLEEVQERLVEEGPGSFVNMTWLQEDISPKEPPNTAEQRMSDRMKTGLSLTNSTCTHLSRKAWTKDLGHRGCSAGAS